MIRKRAFILTEILTGLVLQGGFILVLCGAFYMTLNFYARESRILLAREKGQRVISFVDQRIRHTGLGLWNCESSEELRNALSEIPGLVSGDLTNEADSSITVQRHLPVVITKGNTWDSNNTDETEDGSSGVIKGNILTLLYAQKMTGTNSRVLVIKTYKDSPNALSLESEDSEVNLLAADKNSPDKTSNDYIKSFNASGTAKFITSWAVTATAGVPLLLSRAASLERQIHISADISTKSIDIASGMELLMLRCDRMYVEGDDSVRDTGRNFAFKELRSTWRYSFSEKKRNYVPGILEIYMELNKETHVLDFYVLASGGMDLSLNNACPKSWPDGAVWKDEYRHHYIYVSRKSWHLDNIPANFIWN